MAAGGSGHEATDATEYEYEAFISYRHVELDTRAAERIQRHVEGYRIPPQLRSPGGPKKLGRLFRDQDELPAASSLSQQIDDALRKSRYLIVVCGTHTRESAWVSQEIERFVSYHGIDRVILAIVEGSSQEVVPDSLRKRMVRGDDGQWHEVRHDPLAADLRADKGRRFAQECLRIVATLIGCGYDDLRQRQLMRMVRTVGISLALVAVASMAFATYSWRQERRILAHYRETQRRESEYLATESRTLLEQGGRYEAIQVALDALPSSMGDPDRPYVAEAENALAAALGVYPGIDDWRTCYRITGVPSSGLAHDRAGRLAYFDADRNLCVTDLRTGGRRARIAVEDELGISVILEDQPAVTFAFAGSGLVCVGPDVIGCFDGADGSLAWKRELKGADPYVRVVASPDGEAVAFCAGVAGKPGSKGGVQQVVVLRSEDGSEVGRFDHVWQGEAYSSTRLAFDDAGKRVAALGGGTCSLGTVSGGKVLSTQTEFEEPVEVTWLEDDIAVVTTSSGTDCVELYDDSLGRAWHWTGDSQMIPMGWGVMEQTAHVAGQWSLDDREGSQLVVTCGQQLLLLDRASGEVVSQVERESPFAGAEVVRHEDAGSIVTCLMNGEVSVMAPSTSSSPLAPTLDERAWKHMSSAGETREARVLACDDGLFLAARDTTHAVKVLEYVRDADWPGEPIADLQGCDVLQPLGKGLLVACDDKRVAVLDATSFELQRVIEYEWPDGLGGASDVTVSATSTQTLLVAASLVARDGEEMRAVCEIDPVTGKVVYSRCMEGMSFSRNDVAEVVGGDGTRFAFAYDFSQLALVPLDGSADEWRYEWDGTISRAWPVKGAIVWSGQQPYGLDATSDPTEGADFRDRLYLIGLEGGDLRPETDADLCSALLRDGDDLVSVSGDGTRLVAQCSDGCLRMYDLPSGSLAWETSRLAENVGYLGFLPSGDGVLLQYESGRCVVVDAADGSVAATTQRSLNGILAIQEIGDTGRVMAACAASDWSSSRTMVLTLDEGTLGVSRDLPPCCAITPDESFFIAYDERDDTYWKMPYYTLDELIEQAKASLRGHELDAAERSVYLLSPDGTP